MTKNVLILNGSPRKNGNTEVLVNWLEEGLNQINYKFKRYDLYTMQFKGCSHCNACRKIIDRHGCVLQDDAKGVLDAITQANVFVMASPIYCLSFSGCMSALHDRMYCLFKNEIGAKSLLTDKKILGVFTGAGDAFSGMQYCDAALKEICLYGKADYLDTIGAAKCTTPEELRLRSDLQREIIELIAKF